MDDASESMNGGLASVSSRAGMRPNGNLERNSVVRVSPAVGLIVVNSNGVDFSLRSHATDLVGWEA